MPNKATKKLQSPNQNDKRAFAIFIERHYHPGTQNQITNEFFGWDDKTKKPTLFDTYEAAEKKRMQLVKKKYWDGGVYQMQPGESSAPILEVRKFPPHLRPNEKLRVALYQLHQWTDVYWVCDTNGGFLSMPDEDKLEFAAAIKEARRKLDECKKRLFDRATERKVQEKKAKKNARNS